LSFPHAAGLPPFKKKDVFFSLQEKKIRFLRSTGENKKKVKKTANILFAVFFSQAASMPPTRSGLLCARPSGRLRQDNNST
jgi:hypothetical protein